MGIFYKINILTIINKRDLKFESPSILNVKKRFNLYFLKLKKKWVKKIPINIISLYIFDTCKKNYNFVLIFEKNLQ